MIKPIGILGGTFDPIHFGHLRLALEIYQQLNWQEVRFVPCQQPVLEKTARATAAQRLAMLKLAINNQTGLVIDERELQRATPSYTIDTLISLRKEFVDVPLCLIIGSDIISELPRWHRWQELIQYAHIVIIPRPNYPIANEKFIAQYRVADAEQLHKSKAGYVYVAGQFTPLAISATAIRKQIAAGRAPRYLLPDNVWEYIQREKLYL